MSTDPAIDVKAKVQEVYGDLTAALIGLKVVSLRRPRKWQGDHFTERQIPIAAVTVDCYNKREVFNTLTDVVSRNHVASMVHNGYRNSQSEFLLYINLRKTSLI